MMIYNLRMRGELSRRLRAYKMHRERSQLPHSTSLPEAARQAMLVGLTYLEHEYRELLSFVPEDED